MANKTYEILGEAETAQFCKITIEDGPAAGVYQVNLDSSVEGGLLSVGHILVNGVERNVKINVQSDLPELFATMNARKEAFTAKLQASLATDIARQNFDQKMADEGFETAGNAISPTKFNGNNF